MLAQPSAPTPLRDDFSVAKRFKMSVKTIRKWRSRGGGPPFIKVGALVRYRDSDVEAWLDSRRRKSTSDLGLDDDE